MKVKVKKLHSDAVIPKYAKDGDAGMDLTAISYELNKKANQVTYDTGLAFEIPKGYVGFIFPRSSVYKTINRLSNCVGVIDSGYRGSVKAVFDITEAGVGYTEGNRIMQMIIMPYPEIEFEEVQELDETERGEEGFGSSGAW